MSPVITLACSLLDHGKAVNRIRFTLFFLPFPAFAWLFGLSLALLYKEPLGRDSPERWVQ